MRVSEGGRSGGEAGEGDGGSSAPWCWYIVSTSRWGKKTQFPANIYRACFSSGWYHLEAAGCRLPVAGVITRPGAAVAGVIKRPLAALRLGRPQGLFCFILPEGG